MRGISKEDVERFGSVNSVRTLKNRADSDEDDLRIRRATGGDIKDAGPRAAESANALLSDVRGLKEIEDRIKTQTRVLGLIQTEQKEAATYLASMAAIDVLIKSSNDAGNNILVDLYTVQKDQLRATKALTDFLHPEGPAHDRAKKRRKRAGSETL